MSIEHLGDLLIALRRDAEVVVTDDAVRSLWDRCDWPRGLVQAAAAGSTDGRDYVRIDLYVPLPPVRIAQLGDPADGPRSAEVRARVVACRERQLAREGNGRECNARVSPRSLREVAPLDADARSLLTTASERLGLSARAATRVLRVARTIADLEGETRIAPSHLAEALGYRIPSGS